MKTVVAYVLTYTLSQTLFTFLMSLEFQDTESSQQDVLVTVHH